MSSSIEIVIFGFTKIFEKRKVVYGLGFSLRVLILKMSNVKDFSYDKNIIYFNRGFIISLQI